MREPFARRLMRSGKKLVLACFLPDWLTVPSVLFCLIHGAESRSCFSFEIPQCIASCLFEVDVPDARSVVFLSAGIFGLQVKDRCGTASELGESFWISCEVGKDDVCGILFCLIRRNLILRPKSRLCSSSVPYGLIAFSISTGESLSRSPTEQIPISPSVGISK